MRKYIISTMLLFSFCFFINAQTNDQKIWKKVDNIKTELITAKGEIKVNCLIHLAEYYFGIWDEDNKFLDTACVFSNMAYNEATKIKYNEGIAFALSNRAMCAMGNTDDDLNNNDNEAAYSNAYKAAQDAINYAGRQNFNFIIGRTYDNLRWMEKWKGTPDKFKINTEQAIRYFEKVNGNEFRGGYKPSALTVANCPRCIGTEPLLGWLFLELSNAQVEFNNNKKELIEKSIFYYQKAGAKSGLGASYAAYGAFFSITQNLETGIEYLKKAVFEFHEDNNKQSELKTLIDLCSFYWRNGDFENGLAYGKKSVQLAESLIKVRDAGDADTLRLGQSLYWMAKFYSIAGDFETAFSFMKKARPFYPTEPRFLNPWTIAMGELYHQTGNYDSAMYYLKPFENNQGGKPILSNLYISLKQYDKALQLINEASNLAAERNNQSGLASIYIIAAKAYFGKNDYAAALNKAREGINLMGRVRRSVDLIGAYNLISKIYKELGKNDSAYFYLRQYTNLKDSLLNRQFFIRLNDYKKEAEELKRIGQIKLLQKDFLIKEQELQQQILLKDQSEAQLLLSGKDNELKDQKIKEQALLKEQNQSQLSLLDKENKLKDQQLKQQAFIRNALLGGLLLFILLGIFIFRSLSLKRKNDKLRLQKNIEMQQLASEKKHAELQQQAVELEMQALRAQMNPHFIFNCLSSINRFIFKNDNKLASDYLTRFSRLIRMVLMHSSKKLIPLEDELEMLRLYLDLERLRFKDTFDYSITTTNIVDAGAIFIPPLLLQPFCENAVWHGLMHKESKGHLNIIISEASSENEKVLHCVIEDDGVGREKAAGFRSKSAENEKSLGLKITTERLALLNRENNFNTFYKIEDVINGNNEVAGTKVQLKIRHKESIEELV